MVAQPSQSTPPATPPTSSRKRKLDSVVAETSYPAGVPLPKRTFTASGNASREVPRRKGSSIGMSRKNKASDDDVASTAEEKRLRRFRPKPPQSFNDVYLRATTQRFYVLSRTRCGTPECPEELVEMAGSTGNIYHVHVAKQPTCDCPHAKQGNQCKHLLYVMSRVLRAQFNYVYQLALLSTELREIFASAPPCPGPGDAPCRDGSSNRKPIEGDCPVCFNEFEDKSDTVIWCRAACGQNIHKECFEMWAATKHQNAVGAKAEVTCPYCRSVWKGDDDMVKKIKRTGQPNFEGYVNVADQLGISGVRDTSTYSEWGRFRGQYY